jgi:hypothetical protein
MGLVSFEQGFGPALLFVAEPFNFVRPLSPKGQDKLWRN